MKLMRWIQTLSRAGMLVWGATIAPQVTATEWLPAPAPITAVSTGNAGQYASMTTVNGNPAVSYFEATAFDLVYVRANDPQGSSWGTPVTLQSVGSVGRWTQLLVVNGRPAIAYRDGTELRYIRANDANGSTWGTPVAIGGSVINSVSMALVNGRPAIAFQNNLLDLAYVRANDADGASWGAIQTLDSSSPNGTGSNASLAIINGNPAIAYRNAEGVGTQKFIRATDVNGSAWAAPVIVDAAGSFSTGGEGDMAAVNGRPAMTYQRDNNLYFVRANDANGTSWGTPQNLAANARFTSLTVISGFPAISFHVFDTGDLHYIRASDANGTTWNPVVVVDNSANFVGRNSQLEIIDGHPAISRPRHHQDRWRDHGDAGRRRDLHHHRVATPARAMHQAAPSPTPSRPR
jgi:hypothetical protein